MKFLERFRPRIGVRRNSDEDLLSSLLVMAWMVEARDPYT
jgi:hypothetical protein